ncbi:hypothetical protein QOT17_014851 [Balamuthia mandrillaris]
MTEQLSEAQKIAVLKCCLNPCLLESISNVLLLWNAKKYDQAVQIALSIEANLYAHKTPSSTSCPLHPTSGHSTAECKWIKQMKDGTQMPSKANTGQHHNGNNYGSSSSSSSSSGHPPSNNKHTCCKCSASWHPGHQCKPHQPAALNSSQVQTSSSQQPALASSSPSSLSPSPASPPSGTNWQSTNAVDATTKQESSSPVVIPEAIHVKGLDTGDDDNVEDDFEDNVEPLITAPILLNRQHARAFIDSGDRSTTHVAHHAAHIRIDCGFCKLHHHFFIMPLQGEHEILFGRNIMRHISVGLFSLPVHYPLLNKQEELKEDDSNISDKDQCVELPPPPDTAQKIAEGIRNALQCN